MAWRRPSHYLNQIYWTNAAMLSIAKKMEFSYLDILLSQANKMYP